MQLYYTHNINPRVAVAVAKHLRAPLDYIRFDPMGRDQEMCRPLNPNTRAPVLVENGKSLWETDAIALRLSQLSGTDFWPADHMVETMQWVSWSAHHFTAIGGIFTFENIVGPTFLPRPPDAVLLAQAADDFRSFGAVLDDTLADRDWLVSNRLSYADFRVATALPFAAEAGIPVAEFPNIVRWHDRLNQLEAWREPFAGIA